MASRPDSKWLVVAGGVAAVVAVAAGVYLARRRGGGKASAKATTATAARGTAAAQQDDGAAGNDPVVQVEDRLPAGASDEAKAARANQFKKDGNSFYQKKKYKEAIDCYTKALEVYPHQDKDRAIFYCNRAACHLFLKNHAAVIEDCTAALDIDPTYEKARHRRGQGYEAQGDNGAALLDYTEAYLLSRAQSQTAKVAMESVLPKIAAEKAIERMKTRKPVLPSVSLVSTYLTLFPSDREETQSVDELTQAISQSPDDGVLYYRRALASLNEKQWDSVLGDCNKAIELLESKPEEKNTLIAALNVAGTFFHLQGQFEESQDLLAKSAELDAENVNTIMRFASVLLDGGNIQLATEMFKAGLKKDPNNALLHFHQGQCFYAQQQLKEAEASYRKAIALDPDFFYAYIQCAVTCLHNGQHSAVDELFQAAIARKPDEAEIYVHYGQVLMSQNRVELALAQFNEAISRDPDNATAIACKSMFAQSLEEAHAQLLTAIKKDPRCETAYLRIAPLELQLGKTDDAIAHYEAFISITSNKEAVQQVCQSIEAAYAQREACKDPALASMLAELGVKPM